MRRLTKLETAYSLDGEGAWVIRLWFGPDSFYVFSLPDNADPESVASKFLDASKGIGDIKA